MKVSFAIITVLFSASFTSSVSLRSLHHATSRQSAEFETEISTTALTERIDESLLNYLGKRRGGGSGGSRGGSSSSSGSSGSSGSRSGNTGSARLVVVQADDVCTVPNDHSSSSSSSPSFGGGRYYGGGATTAYRAGGRSPAGLVPYAVAFGALGIFPGLWLAGAYGYNFNHPYRFRNSSNANSSESLPVVCLCEEYRACGCDDDGNTTYIDDLVGNGSASDQDPTLVHVGNVNGTKTVVINGTLPNGTDDSSSSSTSSTTSGAMRLYVLEMSGYWVASAIVIATVFT